MKNQPLVSVLMTAYNREEYIAEAIESVLASTYQNWELIIVDDCSTDRTVEIAKSYEAKDERIKVYKNKTNIGQFPNRNKSADYAKGKYLKFLDSDDLIYPFGLEQLVFYMEQFPEAGYGLCSLEQDNSRIFPFMLSPQEAYYSHYIDNKWLFHKAPLSSIIKKDAYFKVNGFTDNRVCGDFSMWNKLSRYFNVLLMPQGIVWYREHLEQEMQKARSNINVAFEYLTSTYDSLLNNDNPLSENDKSIAIKNIERKQARYILRHLKSHGLKMGNQLRKQANMSWAQVFKKAFQKI